MEKWGLDWLQKKFKDKQIVSNKPSAKLYFINIVEMIGKQLCQVLK